MSPLPCSLGPETLLYDSFNRKDRKSRKSLYDSFNRKEQKDGSLRLEEEEEEKSHRLVMSKSGEDSSPRYLTVLTVLVIQAALGRC